MSWSKNKNYPELLMANATRFHRTSTKFVTLGSAWPKCTSGPLHLGAFKELLLCNGAKKGLEMCPDVLSLLFQFLRIQTRSLCFVCLQKFLYGVNRGKTETFPQISLLDALIAIFYVMKRHDLSNIKRIPQVK